MHKPLRDSEDYIRSAQEARQTVNKIMKNLTEKYPNTTAFPYSLVYIYYDQYTYIRAVAVQNLLLAVAVVLLTLVVMQNLKLALIITVTVLFTTFNLIGVVYIDNLIFKDHGFIIEINAISVTFLLLRSSILSLVWAYPWSSAHTWPLPSKRQRGRRRTD